MCFACGSLSITCSNLPFSFTFFPAYFEMRFPSPFESLVRPLAVAKPRSIIRKQKMRIIEEANNFLLRMHLTIPRHYQMPTQPCIITSYTTYKKKKKKHDDRNKPTKAIRHKA